eukprot:7629875-Alexandrium_andersonii.AAC.1
MASNIGVPTLPNASGACPQGCRPPGPPGFFPEGATAPLGPPQLAPRARTRGANGGIQGAAAPPQGSNG